MKTLKNSMMIGILLIASTMMSQNQEVEFDVYSSSAAKASRYLLADDVALRDCPSAQCEQLTTLNIGTNVRLLAKSETPQTINDICSRWYKVKIGPQIGWIWGGLIAQKTMISHVDNETKFVFGEAGENINSQKQYQIRAVKNGLEVDRIIFKSYALVASQVELKSADEGNSMQDIFLINALGAKEIVITFEQGSFKKSTIESVSMSDEIELNESIATN